MPRYFSTTPLSQKRLALTPHLGKFDGDWTAVARPVIETRMLQYEEDQISFNLLALCRSPLCALSEELGANIQSMRILMDMAKSKPNFKDVVPPEDEWLDEGNLDAFHLSKYELSRFVVTDEFITRISKPAFEVPEALDLYQSLLNEQKRIKAQFRDEKSSMDDDERQVMGRQMDYTPAIHEWIKKLCEHGVLRDLVEEAS